MPVTSGEITHPGVSTENHERMLDGFPWVTGIIIYTLSWGGSLLHPNSIYWFDWDYIFNRPHGYLNQIFVDTGLPVWRALIDQEMLKVGYWTLQFATFLMFFSAGIFVYGILKEFSQISDHQRTLVVLVFLVAPVNHARIALTMFGYTTSVFLFFLSWLVLIRYRNWFSFFFSVLLFFWSFQTHSLFFFFIFPVSNFVYFVFCRTKAQEEIKYWHFKLLTLILLIPSYLMLRAQYWAPTPEYVTYQTIRLGGTLRGGVPVFVTLIVLAILFYRKHVLKRSDDFHALLLIGFLFFTVALFPYFASGKFTSYVQVFAFRQSWGSRILLLTPLGIAFIVIALNDKFKINGRSFLAVSFCLFSIILNLFFASEYYLETLKQKEVVKLIRSLDVVDSQKRFVVVDNAKQFNGRYNHWEFEWPGLVHISGRKNIDVSSEGCDSWPNADRLTLQPGVNYLEAIVTRDLGLYFDMQPCSEVIAQGD